MGCKVLRPITIFIKMPRIKVCPLVIVLVVLPMPQQISMEFQVYLFQSKIEIRMALVQGAPDNQKQAT